MFRRNRELDGSGGGASSVEAGSPSYVVGIGASAGGLEALERLFKAMPPNTGMAFVVVQHLSPDFRSLMDELLARFTSMTIVRVSGPEDLRPNTIYLLSPGKELLIADGRLVTKDRRAENTLNVPINTFFRSLARELREKAIAIVLSGTGTDGTIGLMDVHDMGGLVLAQSEETAKFDGMPRSAIDTGLADAVMAPEEMPAALLSYAKNPSMSFADSRLEDRGGEALAGLPGIFQRLRESYEVDFSLYKPATVSRRIERRMALSQCGSIQEFTKRLTEHPSELDLLFKDLLIGVTRFFRDPEAFEVLRTQVVLPLVDATPADEEIRVWVAGCATGEEAYSLGILFLEALDARGRPPNLKIFASDLHRDSLAVGAEGVYPVGRLDEMSPERRDRFFVQEDSQSFRVSSRLRKLLVFSTHNLIKDPPFTKIDLVSCRNLLIYFQPNAQNKVLAALHFALKLNGTLFLGPSEGPADLHGEFETIDRSWHLYRKAHDSRLPMDLRISVPIGPARAPRLPVAGDLRLARAYDVLLDRYVPTGVLVNERREVLHLFGDSDRFLRPQAGRMTHDVVAMARGDLRIALSSAIHGALKRSQKVVFKSVVVGDGDSGGVVDLSAEPLADRVTGAVFVLVLFLEERSVPAVETGPERPFKLGEEAQARIQQLESELQYTKETLQTTVEELQTSNEELQASNEELQASNEELQSTNEELHSVNEELYSVNAELEQKIREVDETASDLKNLMQASEIGTVFTDALYRIRLFTPAAAGIFNLLAQDIGRDIRHITSCVKDDDVIEDIDRCIATCEPQVKRVVTQSGRAFLRRVAPYLDQDREPVGLILTFVEITALDAAERQFQAMFEGAPQAIVTVDAKGKVMLVNSQAERTFGYERGEMVGLRIEHLVPERFRDGHAIMRQAFGQRREARPMGNHRELFALRRDGTEFPVEIGLSPIDIRGETCTMALITDVSERLRMASEHRKIEGKLQETARLESLGLLAGGIAHDFNNILMGVVGNISLMAEDLEETSALRERCRDALAAAMRAGDLCKQMLAYSGRGQFVLSRIDVGALVRETLPLVKASLGKNVQVEVRDETTPAVAELDVSQIRQVIMNLVINAAEAMAEHAGKIRIRVGVSRITVEETLTLVVAPPDIRGNFVYIEVSDDGAGIKKENLKRIFDPFFTTKFAGRGLGLAATQGIVRGHKGGLSVVSQEGLGSTFRLSLPACDGNPSGDREDLDRAVEGWRGEGKVLVIDDEEPVRQAVSYMLERLGFQPVPAEDGRQACDLLAAGPDTYRCAMLDLTMPGMDGVETFAELRRIRPDLKVLLISGYNVRDAAMRYAGLGIAGFLQKPFGVTALQGSLRSILVPEAR